VRALPDGYTLLLVTAANAINTSLYEKLSFNLSRDIAPVAGITRVPNVTVVNPSVPSKTVPEFIAYAKAHPGKLNMASGGNGTTVHLSGELFKMMTGINVVHVPYRGAAPALTGLLGGQVQVMFATMPSSIAYIRAGQLRPLAVTTTTRSDELPEVPTVNDFVPGYEASTWYSACRPAHPLRSSASSTRKSTPRPPTPRSRHALPMWVARRCWARPPISGNSSLTKPTSGPR
jgi:tripartite-type tricarboxylate transporter receptor subunit TctC